MSGVLALQQLLPQGVVGCGRSRALQSLPPSCLPDLPPLQQQLRWVLSRSSEGRDAARSAAG